MTHDAASPFHRGELAVQERGGAPERLRSAASHFIRDYMPEQHRELFVRLPTLFVGSVDAAGQPWASILTGEPGFLQSPDSRHLVIEARPREDDPLREQLKVGVPLGLLGIEPQTRRRNRMNGTVVEVTDRHFTVEVDQSFGNCPQYIQARAPRWVARSTKTAPARHGDRMLAAQAAELVRRADTFYVASASPHARGHGGAHGVDVSHRGGKPGFLHVTQEHGGTVLVAPDFRGNFLFNTLGNVAINPRAGLLIIDYERGDVLQITGAAEILWDEALVRAYAGARRLLRVTVESSRWFEGALPLQWSAPEFAPQLAATGSWHG